MEQADFVLPRKRLPSPNPLFLSWLQEMKTEAKNKQWKSFKHFQKAVSSMEKYPLLLKSGKECAILEGIGQRTCLLIDQKLAALAKGMKCSVEEALNAENGRLVAERDKSLKRKKRLSRKRPFSDDHKPTPSSSASPKFQGSAAKRCRTMRSPGYRPRVGSGAHALVLALNDFHLRNPYEDGVTKEDLIQLAQPLCDSSFRIPSVAGSYYTAWSSMGDLAKKDLVKMQRRHRNQSLYFLTNAGKELAAQLKGETKVDEIASSSRSGSSTTLAIQASPTYEIGRINNNKAIHYVSDSECETDKDSHQSDAEKEEGLIEAHDVAILEEDDSSEKGISPKVNPKKSPNIDVNSFLARCMLDDEQREKSNTSFHEESFGGALPLSERLHLSPEALEQLEVRDLELAIKNSLSDLHDPKTVEPEPNGPALSFPFSYISASRAAVMRRSEALRKEDAVDNAAGYLVQCDMVELTCAGCRYVLDLDSLGQLTDGQVMAFLHEEDAPTVSSAPSPPAAEPKPGSTSEVQSLVSEKTVKKNPPKEPEAKQRSQKDLSVRRKPPKEPAVREELNAQVQRPAWRPEQTAGPSAPSARVRECAEDENLAPPTVLHELEAGEADIRMIVDTREHFGMGRVKQLLLPALLNKGTPCEVRALPVGDFVWVVRQRGGSNASGMEAVLDCVVERKRMDDLASSLTDGRYREQKARMKKSGFSRIIYLIENFGGLKHTSISPDTLMQTLANSQIVDKCMLIFCRDAEETVSYLSALTNQLQQEYMSRRLKIVDRWQSDRDAERQAFCLEWKSFQAAAAKSPNSSVRLLFAKQLLRLNGTGPECVEAILGVCPTPRSLIQKCSSMPEHQWDKAFSELKRGNLQKKVGSALSRSICMFYSAK